MYREFKLWEVFWIINTFLQVVLAKLIKQTINYLAIIAKQILINI